MSSQLFDNAVSNLMRLPGIGRSSAMRHALFIMRQDKQTAQNIAEAILTLSRDVKRCNVCHDISDTDTCAICSDTRRDHSTICVVADIEDVMALERSAAYRGVYHVLGGVISPMNGVAPPDLFIAHLIERVKHDNGTIREIIFALPSTMEGDTTAFYITRQLEPYRDRVTLTTIARGISVGEELQYTDDLTLTRALEGRREI